MAEVDGQSETVLVFTPTGRDATLVSRVIETSGRHSRACGDTAGFLGELNTGGGAAVIAEECLTPASAETLSDWVARQPPWSDFPFIVLTSGGESTARSLESFERLRALGNITLLERPVRTVTLISAVESALRARRRQYETQAYIAERIQAEDALAAQADELVRSNADLQQFAYVTSHDLQEPLRTIHAYSQFIQRRYAGRLDAEADEFLGYITAAARRMRDLIDDLLHYSRVVNLEPRPLAPVPMDGVVHWALENLQLSVLDSGAAIASADLPTVYGDQVKLVQLVQNLLSNAIKYRRMDQPLRIEIEAERSDGHWLFRVRDNGQGIAPEYHDRIFGLFKRLHGNDVPGTGMGLAICRKIVEQHQGRLWVESAAGAGATFCFTLPAPD